jgi:hypothetical protein
MGPILGRALRGTWVIRYVAVDAEVCAFPLRYRTLVSFASPPEVREFFEGHGRTGLFGRDLKTFASTLFTLGRRNSSGNFRNAASQIFFQTFGALIFTQATAKEFLQLLLFPFIFSFMPSPSA